jgi:hypothetical protein
MKRFFIPLVVLALALVTAGVAVAQSGHFLTGGGQAPTCVDNGTTVTCSGKVAGLGGTTFRIDATAAGIAEVVCVNPAGHRAPGQDTAVTVPGTTDDLPTPRNGNFRFTITSDDPEPLPPTPTCPNNQWTPEIVDVEFTTVFLELFENGTLSDSFTFTF